MLQRTAKSCGPDAPTLASSSRSRVGPTGLRHNVSPWTTVANKPGHRGARRKPLKPLRAGMPGDSGVLVVTRVRSITTSAHEAAGATGIRRSPRPLWAEDSSTARAHGAARSRTCVCRHCEERSDEAIHSFVARQDGLLRFARNDVIMRSPRAPAVIVCESGRPSIPRC